ncbi:hypothetical protein EDB87DRAFT_1418205 [Lactarius vividus]|nr:hypothetical protein EDB87DRAFT_1418205 [Lactarius vividus]
MSRALNDSDDIDSHETRIGTYPPQSAPTQAKHGEPDFIDGSGLIFSMYMEMATEEDKKMAENWTADADGILVFTGLFSSAVASMISISIQDIRPNPQDTSNFYLANIYYLQTVADTNRPNISSSLPSSPPPFSPPNYAVLVNALWFMSLVISISCALLATLLQQWARRYLRVTQPRYSLHKRAKIRTFFFDGVSAGHQALEIGALPTLLLHVSLFLFFAGLVVFLRNVHLTIFKLALSWVSMCMALYGLATFMPPIRHNTPFHTPFSPFAFPWVSLLVSYMQVSVSHMRAFLRAFIPPPFKRRPSIPLLRSFRKIFPQGIRKTVEETALKLPVIDARALMWTFDSLDEDHELERFFSGFPGFRSSSVVDDPLPVLYSQKKERLSMGLIGLFDRTLSSDLLPEPIKNRRAIICAKALDPAQFPYAYWDILRRVMSEDQHKGLKTAEFVRVMRSWSGGRDRGTAVLGEAIFASLVARAQRHDDSWLISAPDKLGIPEADLRRCAADGNSLLLTSLIYMIRYQFNQLQKTSRLDYQLSEVLEAVSKFGIQDTSPDLQHEFCTLWNQIVLKAWRYYDKELVTCILKPIWNVYIALHQDTNSSPTQFPASTHDYDPVRSSPYSYPVCEVAGHIHGNSASTTVSHDNAALVPASLASPDNPSLSVSATPQAIESFMDMPLLDNSHT